MDAPSTPSTPVVRRVVAFLVENWPLLVILTFALAVRCYHVNHPPSDFLNWRETQTLMIARNFFREGMNLFRPAIDWRSLDVSPVPRMGIVGATELQVTPWLTAWLYHVFGMQYWVGRVVPMAFSILGLAFFYGLVRDFYGKTCALFATLCLSMSPFHLFCGRVQMPESLAFASMFAALYYHARYCARPSFNAFVKAACAMAVMLLAKPQMCIAAVPMLYVTWTQWGWRAVLRRDLYALLLCVAMPVTIFTWYSYGVLVGEAGLYFVKPAPFTAMLRKYLADPTYFQRMASLTWSVVVGPAPCVLAGLGLFVVPRFRREGYVLAWLAGTLLFLVLFAALNDANVYYQMMFAPPVAVLAGRLLSKLTARKWLIPLALVGATAACANSLALLPRLFEEHDPSAVACGTWVREHTPPGTLVYCTNPSPTMLYFADRKGWTPWMGGLHVDAIEKAQTLGAQLVAVPDDYFDTSYYHRFPDYPASGTRDWLYDHFNYYHAGMFVVFGMDMPADLQVPPDGCVPMGTPLCRRYLRGQWEWNRKDAQGLFTSTGPANGISTIKVIPPAAARSVRIALLASQPAKVELSINGKVCGARQFDKPWQTVEIEVPLDKPAVPGTPLILSFALTDNAVLAFRRICFSPVSTP